jgi:hypothetical protein
VIGPRVHFDGAVRYRLLRRSRLVSPIQGFSDERGVFTCVVRPSDRSRHRTNGEEIAVVRGPQPEPGSIIDERRHSSKGLIRTLYAKAAGIVGALSIRCSLPATGRSWVIRRPVRSVLTATAQTVRK